MSYSPFRLAEEWATIRVSADGGTIAETYLLGSGAHDERGLRITPTSLDFGRIPVGAASGTQTVTVTNQGASNRAVHVNGTLPAAPFEVASQTCTSTVQILTPGASCTITYRFRPTAVGEAYWFNTVSVVTAPDGHSHQVPLELTGRGGDTAAEPIRVTPRRLDFGDVTPGVMSGSQAVTLTNISSSTVTYATAGGGAGEFGGTSTCSGTLAPGATCTFSYAADIGRSGTVTGATRLDLRIDGREVQHRIEMSAFGLGSSPNLGISHDGLNLGPGGGITTATVTVRNNGSAPLTGVSLRGSVTAPFSATSTCPTTIAAGASCQVGVRNNAAAGTAPEAWGSVMIGSTSHYREIRFTSSPVVGVHQRFVRFAHIVFLNRLATPAEVTSLGGALDAGTTSRATVIRNLANSTEWVRTIVQRMYRDTLGRDGEAGGVSYWTEEIRSGRRSVAQVAGSFYASPEYFNGLGGATVPSWISDLYVKLLQRRATPGDITYWQGQVTARGRTDVATRMFQSNESARTRVTGLYEDLLDRRPSASDLAYWAPRVVREGDVALAINLASSPEFLRISQTYYAGG